jgi:hypothetical protein
LSAHSHQSQAPVQVKSNLKSREWALSIVLAGVVIVHLYVFPQYSTSFPTAPDFRI